MVRAITILIALTMLSALAACGGGDSNGERDAIRTVAGSDAYSVIGIEDASPAPGERDCRIPHGGPRPIDPSDEMVLDGLCTWEAEKDGDDWLVSFTESWGAPENLQVHTWTYRVGATAGVSLVDEDGATAPQYWE